MNTVFNLREPDTALSDDDIRIIENLSGFIQIIADISQSDVFIDCPLRQQGSAVVVAQAHPTTAKSLYSRSVVGQLALTENEPGVIFSLQSGKAVIGARGISQEKVVMQQNIVPIKNHAGRTIGTLIMEQDISEKVEQEKNVEMLMETTEHLSATLLQMAMSESKIPTLIHEGILVLDEREMITYANAQAYELLRSEGQPSTLKGRSIRQLGLEERVRDRIAGNQGMFCEEIQLGKRSVQLKAVALLRNQQVVGSILLLRDLTDLKEKEKQLMIKSAVIKEIHHRVKNNLQTISSLLRLQMRRSNLPEVKKTFRESINRISSIAIVHEFLARDGLEEIDCKEVLEKNLTLLISSMDKKNQSIELSFQGESLVLPAEKVTSLVIVVNELLQNCVNHAFADQEHGNIMIQLYSRAQMAHLMIKDDGKGIDSPSFASTANHLGLQIVETLVREDLDGMIGFHNTGKGTEVVITFPISKEG